MRSPYRRVLIKLSGEAFGGGSVGVDPDVDVLLAGHAAVGGLDAVLDGPDELLPGDLLLGVQLEEGTDEIPTHLALHAASGPLHELGDQLAGILQAQRRILA